MTEPTVPRQRATYSMPFKPGLVQRSLQSGACVALLACETGINDNLLFTWRQRCRHLIDEPSDTPPASAIISKIRREPSPGSGGEERRKARRALKINQALTDSERRL